MPRFLAELKKQKSTRSNSGHPNQQLSHSKAFEIESRKSSAVEDDRVNYEVGAFNINQTNKNIRETIWKHRVQNITAQVDVLNQNLMLFSQVYTQKVTFVEQRVASLEEILRTLASSLKQATPTIKRTAAVDHYDEVVSKLNRELVDVNRQLTSLNLKYPLLNQADSHPERKRDSRR